jgi:hypothetical protein
MTQYFFDLDSSKRIGEAVKQYENQPQGQYSVQRSAGYRSQSGITIEGLLDDDMDAPVDPISPVFADMTVYRRNAAGALVATTETQTVTNRDPNSFAVSGDYIIVTRINCEWRPAGAQFGGVEEERDGAAVLINTPGQTVYNATDDDGYIQVDTSVLTGTGGIVDVNLPSPLSGDNEGHYVTVANIAAGPFIRVNTPAETPLDPWTPNRILSNDFQSFQSSGKKPIPRGLISVGFFWWRV